MTRTAYLAHHITARDAWERALVHHSLPHIARYLRSGDADGWLAVPPDHRAQLVHRLRAHPSPLGRATAEALADAETPPDRSSGPGPDLIGARQGRRDIAPCHRWTGPTNEPPQNPLARYLRPFVESAGVWATDISRATGLRKGQVQSWLVGAVTPDRRSSVVALAVAVGADPEEACRLAEETTRVGLPKWRAR